MQCSPCSGQKCGNSSCCEVMGSSCGPDSRCSGMSSTCGDRSVCLGPLTQCGANSVCSGLGSRCGPGSLCAFGASCHGVWWPAVARENGENTTFLVKNTSFQAEVHNCDTGSVCQDRTRQVSKQGIEICCKQEHSCGCEMKGWGNRHGDNWLFAICSPSACRSQAALLMEASMVADGCETGEVCDGRQHAEGGGMKYCCPEGCESCEIATSTFMVAGQPRVSASCSCLAEDSKQASMFYAIFTPGLVVVNVLLFLICFSGYLVANIVQKLLANRLCTDDSARSQTVLTV